MISSGLRQQILRKFQGVLLLIGLVGQFLKISHKACLLEIG